MPNLSLPFQLLTVEQACQQLHQGKVIAYPTEAVFGLGCNPLDETALEQIFSLKNRPKYKGLILIASDWNQLDAFIEWSLLPENTINRMKQTSSEVITWVVPATSNVSKSLRGEHETVAVRVSQHPIVIDLCFTYGGALVSTSANLSKQEAARTHQDIAAQFANQVDCLQGELGGANKPSTIMDARTGEKLR